MDKEDDKEERETKNEKNMNFKEEEGKEKRGIRRGIGGESDGERVRSKRRGGRRKNVTQTKIEKENKARTIAHICI